MSNSQIIPTSPLVSAKYNHVVNVTGIKVSYKKPREDYPVSICILIGDKKTNRSQKFTKPQDISWDLKEEFSSAVEFTVVIREHHRIKRRDRYIRTTVSVSDMIMKPVFVVDELNGGEMSLIIHCDTAGLFVELVRRLVEEAQGRLSNMKPFVEQLGKVCEALNIIVAMSEPLGDAHPAAKAAVGVATLLYEKCNSMQRCHAAAIDLMESIANFIPFTDIPTERCKSPVTARTAESLLEAFREISRTILDSSVDGTLGFLLKDRLEEVNGYMDKFKKSKETFDWCVKTEIWKTVLRIEMHTASLLLALLRPVNSAFYVSEKSCFEGTRRDTLDVIERWSSSDSNLFWLYGSEGSGKSTIAHTVAQIFDEQNRLAGSFFADGCDRERRNPESIIPTIAYYLAQWHKPYSSLILDVLSGHAKGNVHNSLVSQINLLMREPLAALAKPSMLKHQPSPHRPLIIVLDALEQCCDSEHSLRFLVGYIRDIAELVPWLKVFVSSRKLPGFDDLPGTDCQELDISDPLVDFEHDISAYVKYHENQSTIQMERRRTMAYRMPGLLSRIQRLSWRLSPLAIGNALVENAVQAEHRGMDELFHLSILAIITRSGYGEDMVPIIRDVLAIVAYITTTSDKSPSKGLVLRSMVPFWPEVKSDTLRDVLHSLQPILSQDKAKVRILFPADLFLDMISDEHRSGAFLADIGLIKHQLARGCLDEMYMHLQFNTCRLETSQFPNKDVRGLVGRIEVCIPEALQYSCQTWLDLVIGSGNTQALSKSVTNLLCSARPLFWLEVLSVIGRLDVAKNLSKLIDHYKDHNDICEAAKELYDFVTSNYTAMEFGAPHVYISSLVWLHGNSFLCRHIPHFVSGRSNVVFEGFTKRETTKSRIDSGNLDNITSIACSSDGSKIVSGHDDGTLNVWDGRTGIRVHGPLEGHSRPVTRVAFCPDGSRFISADFEYSLRIWDPLSGQLVSGPFRAESWITCVALSPDGARIVSGHMDGYVRIWNAPTGDVIVKSSKRHRNGVRAVAYSPGGSRIVSGSRDMTLRIWDANTGASIGNPLSGHGGLVTAVAYSPGGSRIISASYDKTVRVWDAQTGEQLGLWHNDWVRNVAYSRDGSRILSSSDDEMVCMWDSSSGVPLGVIPRDESRWDPEKRYFVSIPFWWPRGTELDVRSLLYSANPLYIPDDGWIRTLDGGLLLWVPPEHRGCECHTTPDSTITRDEQDERLSNSEWRKLIQGKNWARVMDVERET